MEPAEIKRLCPEYSELLELEAQASKAPWRKRESSSADYSCIVEQAESARDSNRKPVFYCAFGQLGRTDAELTAKMRNQIQNLITDLAEARKKLEEQQPIPPTENCEYCGGSGERFWHSEECASDDCALGAGIDDCDGLIEDCPCVLPTPPLDKE